MALPSGKFVIDEPTWQRTRQAFASGMLHMAYVVEGDAKAITPVHGDGSQGGIYSTFVPGAKPIGGTLRRSIHSVAYIDGVVVLGSGGSDDNKAGKPSYDAGIGIEAFVGTNLDYAAFVHDGTAKMKARPFLGTAFAEAGRKLEAAFALGFGKIIPPTG